MNKRGYLRTLEAIIAIILLLVVFYTIIPKYVEPKPNPPLAVQDAQRFIISDISNDENLRTTIITSTDPSSAVEATIKRNIPPNYDFICAICTNTSACITTTPFDKVVYMSDVFIASSIGPSLNEQSPKIVRFWMWNKPTEGLIDKNKCIVIP